MRLLSVVSVLFACIAYTAAELSETDDSQVEFDAKLDSETSGEQYPLADIEASASWPAENPFGHVVNGEKNVLNVVIAINTDNVTIHNIAGSINHAESDALIRNLGVAPYSLPLAKGSKIQLPYSFYSEFKPGDLQLHIWVEHSINGEKDRIAAFDQIISVVEPPFSIFDIKSILTYLFAIGLLGGLGYIGYATFAPPTSKKTRRPKTVETVSAPVGSVTATGAGGYQEEWIPEHHIKKTKSGKKLNAVSGDELSGAETSGAESPAIGGKKRKSGRR